MSDMLIDVVHEIHPGFGNRVSQVVSAPITPRATAMGRANKACEACGELGRYVVAGKCHSCGHMMGEPVMPYWNRL